jgi:enamine deaminase RidA (YjgF/YER057c/UK114 family)
MQLRTLPDGRVLLDSGSRWEPLMGYSRAVRAGRTIHVAGCVGIESDGRYADSLRRQTERCIERIDEALAPFGVGVDAIVRLRIYTTSIERWEEIAAVVGPRFATTRPANALIGVAALIDTAALVEIEAEAWAAEDGSVAPTSQGEVARRGPGG